MLAQAVYGKQADDYLGIGYPQKGYRTAVWALGWAQVPKAERALWQGVCIRNGGRGWNPPRIPGTLYDLRVSDTQAWAGFSRPAPSPRSATHPKCPCNSCNCALAGLPQVGLFALSVLASCAGGAAKPQAEKAQATGGVNHPPGLKFCRLQGAPVLQRQLWLPARRESRAVVEEQPLHVNSEHTRLLLCRCA